MSVRNTPPLTIGDRVFVRGIRTSNLTDERLYDVVAEVLAVDTQHCGCWRITCRRPGSGTNDRFQVYGADCHWPHLDRIDYVAARDEATMREALEDVQLALLPAPEPSSRSLLPVPAQDAVRRVETVYAVGGVL